MSEYPQFYIDLLKRGLAQPGDYRPKVPHRIFYWEEFKRRIDGEFWKSTDVPVAQTTILQARKQQTVPIIMPADFGPFDSLPFHTLPFFEISGRSRYAQLGLEIERSATHEIVKAIETGDAPRVSVKNRSSRAIRIPEGSGLFKFYAESPPSMWNNELLDLFRRGKVSIDGQKGRDWNFDVPNIEDRGYHITEDNGYHVTGVRLRLNPDIRLWLPPKRIWLPGETQDPLEIPETSETHYRQLIDKLLEPVPSSKEEMLWIGETISKVRLSPSVNAVIMAVEPENMRHVNSLLIDGGTDWKIRTEIISPTDSNPPTDIFLHFYA